jgi:TRAP-type C4-dicarboxylate transport system permease small subunit
MLVWLTFLGASAAYRRGVHPGVDVLYRRMPPWLKRTSAVLIHLVSIGLFCVMIVYGYQFAHFVRFQISPALYLPKWIVFSIIPVSGGILTLHGLAFLLAELTEEHHDR